jgi:hypothetical protein
MCQLEFSRVFGYLGILGLTTGEYSYGHVERLRCLNEFGSG